MIWARKYTPAHLHQDGHAVVFPSLRCRILTRNMMHAEYDARRQQDWRLRYGCTLYGLRSAVGCKPREALRLTVVYSLRSAVGCHKPREAVQLHTRIQPYVYPTVQ